MNDQSNQNYSDEDISLIMRAPNITLSKTEQEILDRILQESFDQTHPDFDHYKALENLQKNFNNKVALCKSCFMPKQKEKLEQYEEYCQECYDELNPTPEPEVESQPNVASEQKAGRFARPYFFKPECHPKRSALQTNCGYATVRSFPGKK